MFNTPKNVLTRYNCQICCRYKIRVSAVYVCLELKLEFSDQMCYRYEYSCFSCVHCVCALYLNLNSVIKSVADKKSHVSVVFLCLVVKHGNKVGLFASKK